MTINVFSAKSHCKGSKTVTIEITLDNGLSLHWDVPEDYDTMTFPERQKCFSDVVTKYLNWETRIKVLVDKPLW